VGMLQGEPDRVTHAEVDNGAQGRLTVVARQFVLAGGGIENPRQLLAARNGGGYGTGHDVVGRYYMDHLRFISGVLTPHDATTIQRSGLYDIRETTDGAVVMGKLVPTDQLLRDHRLLHSGAMLLPKLPQELVADVRALMTGARSAVTGKGLPKMSVWRDAFGGAIGLTAMAGRMAIRQRRLPPRTDAGWSGLGGRGRFTQFAVELQVEQAPVRSNQVRLNGVSALGRPTAELVWRWSQVDLESARRTQELFASAISSSGIGNFESTPWDERPPLTTPSGAYHPTGGTRMHSDPTRGVVDADTRVHGVTNLYVTGSSVFPTSGYANPTLTIVALALRTGRHLAALAAASR
jgi:choline dehydrogenase-like flavoprotein